MIGNIKETFPPKTGLREKQLLQDPGYVEDIRDALLHAAYSVQDNVKDVKDIKTSHNRFPLVYLIIVKDVEDVCVRITM